MPEITRIRFSTDSAVIWHQTHLACRGDGDAELTAWSGTDSAMLMVRCRMAAYFGGTANEYLFTTDPPRPLRAWVRLYAGDSILVDPVAIAIDDTTIVQVDNGMLRPMSVGRARLIIDLPGKTWRTFAEVHERIADETLELAAGEFRSWRLA